MTEAPRHHLPASLLRRRSRRLLVVGTALAALCAVPGLWVPAFSVVGVVIAAAAGVASSWLAWTAYAQLRTRTERQLKELSARSDAQLVAVRRSHREIIDVLGARVDRLAGDLRDTRREVGVLKGRIAGLERENVDLATDNAELQARLVAEQHSPSAPVVRLARRRLTEGADGPALEEAAIDLDLRRLAAPFVDEAVAI